MRVLTCAALLLTACGDANGDGGAGGQGGAPAGSELAACPPDNVEEPPHQDFTAGVYSVPVVPVELEAYASYPIGDVTLCWTGTAVRLGYSLPELLIGKKERVSFDGNRDAATGRYELASADGTASCDPAPSAWVCNEAFTGLEIDLDRVAEQAAALPAAERDARLEVAEIFFYDPIGVLDFAGP